MADSSFTSHIPILTRSKQMETDMISTASSVGAARRPLLHALMVERRTLLACTVLVGLSSFVWIAAVTTKQWVHIDGGDGVYMPITNRYFYYGTSGLWQTCRHVWPPPPTRANLTAPATVPPTPPAPPLQATPPKGAAKNNSTPPKNATIPAPPPTPVAPEKPKDLNNITLFVKCTNYLSQELEYAIRRDPAYHLEVAKNSRTMVSFAIISLFVMVMGCGSSAYTFFNPRYMFKRLAAGIHAISTACTMVASHIMLTTLEVFRKEVKVVYPDQATHHFGVSLYLAWFVVLVNLVSALAFFWYSRKRKGNKAATDELAMADEPTIIGR